MPSSKSLALFFVLITINGSALGQTPTDKESSTDVVTVKLTRTNNTGADLGLQELYGKFVKRVKLTRTKTSVDLGLQESLGKSSETIKLTPTRTKESLGVQESALNFLSPVERQRTEAPDSMIVKRWHQLLHIVAGLGSGRIALALAFAAFLLFVGLWPSESASLAVKCLPSRGTASEGSAGQLKKSDSMHGLLPQHNKMKRSSSAYGSLASMSSKIRRSFSGNFNGLP